MKQAASWEVSDALWEKAQPLIPKSERDPNRTYKRKPGGGAKPLPYRQVLAGILYVLRTGCQWKALPKEPYGSSSAIHQRFLDWTRKGFFLALWKAGLMEYDGLQGIDWEWMSIDSSMVKAPLAREDVGKNPTDRGKKGTKRHVLTDGRGAPLSLVVTGANRHDSPQTGPVLEGVIVALPEEVVPKLGGDKGYTGEPARIAAQEHGYMPFLMQRGVTYEKGYLPRRWMVERIHSWVNRFRKLLIRYEKWTESYTGLLQFACAIVCFRMANIH